MIGLKLEILGLKLIYFFMKLLPTRNKIVFISRQSNEPSIDFHLLSNYLKEHMNNYKIITLTKRLENGINATFLNKISYAFHMLSQMYHLATSKVVILDTYCMVVSLLNHKKGLFVLQLWHAIGNMKKFGYAMLDKKEGTPASIANLMKMHKNYTYATISSYSFINDYMKGFNISKDKVLEIPLPKVDLLINVDYINKSKEKLMSKYPFFKDKHNILYAPTFRKDDCEMHSALLKLSEQVDFSKYNLIVSLHPLSHNITLPPNVISLDEETFDLLFVTDYLISDYSTIIYEAGLLKIPFLHYAYDWNTYKTVRELNIDLEKESPGLFTDDPKKIIQCIENNNFDNDKYQEFINKNVTLDGESSCKKIYDLIQKNINNKHANYCNKNTKYKVGI